MEGAESIQNRIRFDPIRRVVRIELFEKVLAVLVEVVGARSVFDPVDYDAGADDSEVGHLWFEGEFQTDRRSISWRI